MPNSVSAFARPEGFGHLELSHFDRIDAKLLIGPIPVPNEWTNETTSFSTRTVTRRRSKRDSNRWSPVKTYGRRESARRTAQGSLVTLQPCSFEK